MTTSCANTKKKIIERDHTTADTNQNTKTADGARGNLGDTLRGFHESIGRLSAAVDALGSRFGVRENMVEEDKRSFSQGVLNEDVFLVNHLNSFSSHSRLTITWNEAN